MKVAIVGTGISGDHIGVAPAAARRRDDPVRGAVPGRAAAGKVENLVARFPATQDRERELGVAHWDDVERLPSSASTSTSSAPRSGSEARSSGRCSGVDFRVYLSRLARGLRRPRRHRSSRAPCRRRRELVDRTGGPRRRRRGRRAGRARRRRAVPGAGRSDAVRGAAAPAARWSVHRR